MSEASRYLPHYTVEDYQHWEGDWELIDGLAISMSPSPFGHHERIVTRLAFELRLQIRDKQCLCELYTNLDWIVSDNTVFRPDLMAVCGDQPDKHLHSAPALAVEVLSPSTRLRDLTLKRDRFMAAGVADYLAIDPEMRSVTHYHHEGAGEYREQQIAEFIAFDLDGSCPVSVKLSSLFDRRM